MLSKFQYLNLILAISFTTNISTAFSNERFDSFIDVALAKGVYSVTAALSNEDYQKTLKKLAHDGYSNSIAAYKKVSGQNKNIKIKKVLMEMGFARSEDNLILNNVSANYRFIPELSTILAQENTDFYDVKFEQLLNNFEETKRQYSDCTLIVEKKDLETRYTLTTCRVKTTNYTPLTLSSLPSYERVISNDTEDKELVTAVDKDFVFSEME